MSYHVPIDRLLETLGQTETPSAQWLRENAAAIRKAHAEMLAEKSVLASQYKREVL